MPIIDTPILDQFTAARQAYLAACDAAAAMTNEYAEAEMHVGANEQERKAAMKRLSPEEYEGWQAQLVALRGPKAAAIAYRDRCEKDYNGIRDLLNYETAQLQRATIELRAEVSEAERITAQLYAATADAEARRNGTRPTAVELRLRHLEAVPVGDEPPF